jgi:drug/metabolite transporter (DMT)-like permease
MAPDLAADRSGTQPIPTLGVDKPGIRVDIGLVTLCIIWGVNFSVIKVALVEIEPLAFNALRFPLAAATLFVLLRWRGPIPIPHREDRARVILLGLLGNLVYQLLFIFGIDGTLAGNASLVLATTPVWTLVLSTVLRQEQHTGAVWIGVLATLGGMVFVVVGGAGATDFSDGLPRGDLLLIAAAVTWSVYTVGAQDLTRRYGALAVTSWTLWFGTVGLVAAGASTVARMDFHTVSLMAWAGVAYAGILAIAVAYLLWNYGLEHIGSARTSVFSNLVPIVALITAALWLGETPSVLQMVGAAIIIGGVWLARVARVKEGASAR